MEWTDPCCLPEESPSGQRCPHTPSVPAAQRGPARQGQPEGERGDVGAGEADGLVWVRDEGRATVPVSASGPGRVRARQLAWGAGAGRPPPPLQPTGLQPGCMRPPPPPWTPSGPRSCSRSPKGCWPLSQDEWFSASWLGWTPPEMGVEDARAREGVVAAVLLFSVFPFPSQSEQSAPASTAHFRSHKRREAENSSCDGARSFPTQVQAAGRGSEGKLCPSSSLARGPSSIPSAASPSPPWGLGPEPQPFKLPAPPGHLIHAHRPPGPAEASLLGS